MDARPIIYMRPGRENTETSPRQIRHLIYNLCVFLLAMLALLAHDQLADELVSAPSTLCLRARSRLRSLLT